MKQAARSALFAAAVLTAACQDTSTPLQSPRSLLFGDPPVVSSRYIVVFTDGVGDPIGLSQTLVNAYGGSLLYAYANAFNGFAATLSAPAAAALQQNPLVAYVEPDNVVSTDGTEQMDPSGNPWGLDRIDQRALPLSQTYTYTSTGAGVHAYIIDSGIWTIHPEFGGRADNVYDVANNGITGVTGEDCNGHGTMVASVVGGAVYGVAKGVWLHGVRVFAGCVGTGFASDVIAGVDWVIAHHASPAVANMSIAEPGVDAALNTAVTNLWNSGVFVAVAAGNYNVDACGYSPASASGSYTVAASTNTDAKADFSDWGACVKAYAPGQSIEVAGLANSSSLESGTSFAAPHVAGVAALYKATFGGAASATVANWVTANATKGVITSNHSGTPNLLLYKSGL